MPNLALSSASLCLPRLFYCAVVVDLAADGGVRLRCDPGMTLRSVLHRLFGIGKTANDARRNRQSWQTLLDAIEARAGRAVRDRIHDGPLRMPGDRGVRLTVAHRIERGSYLSSTALAGISALFRDACALRRTNEAMVQQVLAPVDGDDLHGLLPTLLDGLMRGVADLPGNKHTLATKHPLSATRSYVAGQLKLALQEQAADYLRHEPPPLARMMATCTSELDRLPMPEQRIQWLRDFDTQLAATSQERGRDTSSDMLAADKVPAVAALLSEWRRGQLAEALHRNDTALAQQRESDISSSPTMAALLTERTALLAELKGRELSDAIRRCDHYLSVATADNDMVRWRARRDTLMAQWRRDDLAIQKEHDEVRQQHLHQVWRAVLDEVDQYTARGKRLDEEAVTGIVGRLLSRPSLLRQCIAARNLHYLSEAVHGPARCATMARLIRAGRWLVCDDPIRAELHNDDFLWLATALEHGEDPVVLLDRKSMGRGLRSLTEPLADQHWPLAQLFDIAATQLARYAEGRCDDTPALRQCSASLQVRWRAGCDMLTDRLRSRELGIADLAPVVFQAFKSLLLARHAAMTYVNTEQRAARDRMTHLRAFYPPLDHWYVHPRAGSSTLLDQASVRITARLIIAHRWMLQVLREPKHRSGAQQVAQGEAHRHIQPGGHASENWSLIVSNPTADALTCSLQQRVEQRLRDSLDGTDSSPGLLETVCKRLEEFAVLVPRWRAWAVGPRDACSDPAFVREILSMRTQASQALSSIACVRRAYLRASQAYVGLPADIVLYVNIDLVPAATALDSLEQALRMAKQWLDDGISCIRRVAPQIVALCEHDRQVTAASPAAAHGVGPHALVHPGHR